MGRRMTSACIFIILTLLSGCYVNDFGEMEGGMEGHGDNENNDVSVEEDIEQLQQRIHIFETEISPLILQCDSPAQMQERIEQIKTMPQVKDSWVEKDAFYIEDKSGMLHMWDFQSMEIADIEYEEEYNRIKTSTKALSTSRANGGKRACVLLSDDEKINPQSVGESVDFLFKMYGGFSEVNIIDGNRFDINFFLSEDFLDYDIYFIFSHGMYSEKKENKSYQTHWLVTNMNYKDLNPDDLKKNIPESTKLTNDKYGVWYSHTAGKGKLAVSEHFFRDVVFKKNERRNHCTFKRKPIVYSAACKSMTDNNSFGITFVYTGMADAYLGFSTAQVHGRWAGLHFFRLLFEQEYSFMGAFKALSFLKCKYWSEATFGDNYTCKDFRNYYDKEKKKETIQYLWENTLDADLEYVKSFNDYALCPQQLVDMGGAVKWAVRNIGARGLMDLGDSLRWGEITPLYEWVVDRTDFTRLEHKNYKLFEYGDYGWEPYQYDIDGYGYEYPGRNIGADTKHDAATVYLGEGWRLPTKEDFEDLLYSGKNEVETITETTPNYLLITNKSNGNKIVLPYPDFEWTFSSFVCHYWTSDFYTSINEQGQNEKEAWALLPVGIPPFYQTLMCDCPGYYAGYVRPVYTK